ncbi:hypothetical protein CNMCM5793_008774 [Aspergillus hiratsukae]|uniref:F-box domain-containing protein n=1 Tax=Aspergillus hiratsukae TaxID=1194566 RepID=A0A8H6ULW9_9EURO|nr:hypothetical protein CNMCM5793_008774 [Aspergillus hiratsukae]KAF7157960.1 hypothetical protein CNMCM6106_004249 [Aspergillus hiratsukae]
MSNDMYCAICGVGFRGFLIGDSSLPALEERDRWVNGKMGEEESRENRPMGYDPRLVKEVDFDWLHEVHCLGFNKHATGGRKTFVIGPGEYVDYGELEINRGNDRNRPEDINFTWQVTEMRLQKASYHFIGSASRFCPEGSPGTWINPMASMQSVVKVITGNACLEPRHGLPYLVCEVCLTEQQYLTRNPVLTDKLPRDGLMMFWADRSFKLPSSPCFKRLERVRADPFGKLPTELVSEICEYLSYEELRSLSAASVHATIHISHGSFWKRFIWRTMPWYWEFCDEYERGKLPGDVLYQAIFLWLRSISRLYGLKDSFEMALANRQRIWNACEKIAAAYNDTQRRLSRPQRQNHQLKFDSVGSEESWLTTVGHTRSPGTVRTVSKTWVHEWENVYEHPGNFEITLNSRKDIVGLAVRFRGKRCTFGRSLKDKTVGEEWSTEAALIPGNDWIKGMILRIPTRHRLTDPDAATAIKGVTCVLLGLRGDIAEDHTILRLGLVESLDPTQDETYPEEERMANAPLRVQILGHSVDDVPFVHHLLWSTEGDAFYHGSAPDCRPMWEHPDVHVLPLLDPRSDEDDLAPCHIIQWASSPSDIRRLKSISAWVYTDDSVLPDADTKRPVTNVLGMTAKFIKRPWEPETHVGLKRRAAEEEGSSFYDKLQHFEIDGPGGEYITEVGVTADQSWSAIKAKAGIRKWMQLFSLAILTKVVDLEKIPLREDLQSDEDMQSEASFQSDTSMLSEP